MTNLNKREKILLNVLIWVCIIVGIISFFLIVGENQNKIKDEVKQMEENFNKYNIKLPNKEELELKKNKLLKALEEEKTKFYFTEDIDQYKFGIIIKNLLVKYGIKINRYKTIEVGGKIFLEFAVTADPFGFYSFLKKISTSKKYWKILFISIKSPGKGGKLSVVFRITYEKID